MSLLIDMFPERKTIFLLNGPPSSGKDTIAKFVSKTLTGFEHESMAKPLKLANKAFFGLTDDEFFKYDTDPVLKNTKQDRFGGFSWREVNIGLSEEYIKGKFGKSIFGIQLAERIKKSNSNNFLISDSGFIEEVTPLIKEFGSENIFHIKLERPGYDFKNDSRGYISVSHYNVKTTVFNNIYTKQEDVEWAGLELIQSLFLGKYNK